MNKLKKIFFGLLVFVFLFLFCLPMINVLAEDTWSGMFDTTKACPCDKCPVNTANKQYVRMQLAIPGITETCTIEKDVWDNVNNRSGKQTINCYFVEANLPEFIKQIYNFSIGLIAIIAVMIIMISGLRWILAGGNPGQIKEAQDAIKAAVSGLVLILLSYAILNTINPNLTNLQMTQPSQMEGIQSGSSKMCGDLTTGSVVVIEDGAKDEFSISKDVNDKIIDIDGLLKCGQQYPVKDKYYADKNSKQTKCIGQYCKEGFCLNLGAGIYNCSDGFWSGQINYQSNWYVTKVKLAAVCKGSNNYDALQHKHEQTFNDPQNNYYYNVVKSENDLIPNCGVGTPEGNKQAAGYILLVLVQRGNGQIDDWYALDKNCKLIKGDAKSENDDPSNIDWSGVSTDKFLKYDELVKYHTCDIYIDNTFINR